MAIASNRRRSALALRLSLGLMVAGSLGNAPPSLPPSERPSRPGAVVERRVAAMGTLFSLSLEAASRNEGLAASEAAVAAVERVEALLSTWRPGGPLDRLNGEPPGQDLEVGTDVAAVLERVLDLARRTDRAFDPTVLPLVRAWDIRGRGRVPADDELARASAATGPELFRCDPARGTARRLAEGAAIDEGAWGKGWALDVAGDVLRARGVRSATLDLGGQLLALGRARIRVADPRARTRPAAVLEISGGSVSTSGDSERSLVAGGRRIGHLLDPRTGRPARDFGSATVVAPTGLVADVLSTALFVAGPERGPALSERLRREGIEHRFLFLVVADGGLKAVASPDLEFERQEQHP